MKQRLFFNWTLARAVYLVVGLLILVQSVMVGQWLGIVLGSYFASMGLFAFGCAAGNCPVDSRPREPKQQLPSEGPHSKSGG